MIKNLYSSKGFIYLACLALISLTSCKNNEKSEDGEMNSNSKLALSDNNADLTLPDGFGVVKVADSVGAARHLAVTADGSIYVNLNQRKDGNGILYIQDTDGDGVADSTKGFADYGGTGIYLSDQYLYASSDQEIFRYKLDENQKLSNATTPDTLVTGLINRRQHASKSITLDDAGNIYVNIGAYSNSCQQQDRTPGSQGMQPCPILDSAGGIWRFNADKLKQSYGDGTRYATGLRNVVGLDWNKQNNKLFVMQHGRDQLHTLFPDLYDEKASATLPAETMYMLNEGDDAGWPYIYYDQQKNKKILAPEYGGDGEKTGAENAIDPVVAFPGHIAPNALLFYTGDMFPEKYKNGAFIAFHGSWNRAPEEQEGFMVAFVPFKNGEPSGDYEVFADGFAGMEKVESPGDAAHRPTGLAQGPDGSLYVSDDAGGSIYRIVYNN